MTMRYTELNITNIALLVYLLYVTFTLNMLLKSSVNNTEQQNQSVLQGHQRGGRFNCESQLQHLASDLLHCAHVL